MSYLTEFVIRYAQNEKKIGCIYLLWNVKVFLSAFLVSKSSDDLTGGSIDEAIEDGDTVLHLRCLYCHAPCVQVRFQLHFMLIFQLLSSLCYLGL